MVRASTPPPKRRQRTIYNHLANVREAEESVVEVPITAQESSAPADPTPKSTTSSAVSSIRRRIPDFLRIQPTVDGQTDVFKLLNAVQGLQAALGTQAHQPVPTDWHCEILNGANGVGAYSLRTFLEGKPTWEQLCETIRNNFERPRAKGVMQLQCLNLPSTPGETATTYTT